MSFASQIISTVNQDTSNEDNSNDILSTPNASTSSASSESDIGFKTDINTQIRESSIPRKLTSRVSSSSPSLPSSGSSSSTKNIISTTVTNSSWMAPFLIFGNSFIFVISIIIICTLVLRIFLKFPVPGNLFTYLGKFLDSFVGYIYELFMKFIEMLGPVINSLLSSIYGSADVATTSAARGLKSTSDITSDIVDDITDPVLKKKEKNVDKSLVDDLRKSSKKKLVIVSHDDSNSDIQTLKKPWCYIGEDNGTRMCAKTEGNECVSGILFTSKDKCIRG